MRKDNRSPRRWTHASLLLLCTAFLFVVCGLLPAYAADTPFTRVTIDNSSPRDPWAKRMADLDGDGFMDMIVASGRGEVVWYRYPTWTKFTIDTAGGTQSGSWVADLVGDGYLDVIVGGS